MPAITRVHHLSCHRPLTLGDISVQPYPVPHDAREPCQFTFGAAGAASGC
jgi:phosphoribosyl 1,2-cyclic phosphodiesterase